MLFSSELRCILMQFDALGLGARRGLNWNEAGARDGGHDGFPLSVFTSSVS